MPITYSGICENCGKEYHRKPSPKFCSWACYVASRWMERTCEHCGKKFMARKVYVARGQMRYCSVKCGNLAAIKRPVVEHNGDRYTLDNQGYYVASPNKKLHRIIWEEANGPIPDGHIIHHRDGDKTNNDIANLELIAWGVHSRNHNISRAESLPTKFCVTCGKVIGHGHTGRKTCSDDCWRLALSRAGIRGNRARHHSR